MTTLERAEFAVTVARIDQLPPPDGPEVALAGRSNAGKSSALNVLTRRRSLAFVAKTPGKTRTIQFYRVGHHGYLVDLPGYGYAQVSKAERLRWSRLIEHYLGMRPTLAGLVLVMDVRHPFTELDRTLLDWLGPRGIPVHILLTKADKLSRGAAAGVLQRVRAIAAREPMATSVQLFSSLSGAGAETARESIGRWLGLPEEAPRPTGERGAEIKTPG